MNPPLPSRPFAFLGNYVPRRCGIATFTHSLVHAVADRAECLVAAIEDGADPAVDHPPEVGLRIDRDDPASYLEAADALNRARPAALCLQHEFGIFGGPAGGHVLGLLERVRMPVVTTLHTVLREPDGAQRRVMDGLLRRSDRVVVMARCGMKILRDTYGMDPARIDIIPHGIPDLPLVSSAGFKHRHGLAGKQVLLTFGLLGPGKGIEYAIRAMPRILARHPAAIYLVIGATHPNLLARDGEACRERLEALAAELGVGRRVRFINRFVSEAELRGFVGAADLYLTPYLNEAQITSGTLALVAGAGKAVVSTPYWHARELLADGRGVLVPFRDPSALAAAVCGLLDHPGRIERIRRRAHRAGREAIWPNVAERYLASFRRACEAREARACAASAAVVPAVPALHLAAALPSPRLKHVARMTDGTGLFQHAIYNVPNHHEGYCTDDNARAFLLCTLLSGPRFAPGDPGIDLLATRYLAFLAGAFHGSTGRFRNFMNHERRWLEEFGSEDSHGRALWALGHGAIHAPDAGHRRLCAELFERGLPAVVGFTSPRAWAFTLLGIEGDACDVVPGLAALRDELTGRLMRCRDACAGPDWPWFEGSITYENARLCQALIRSGGALGDREVVAAGLASLRWLAGMQTAPQGHFRPVGCHGFHTRDGERADFDQQPVEAQAMVSACLEALRVTGDPGWWQEALRAFEWFLGRNDLGLPLHDPETGGCRDGLHHHLANENQGAESTLAFQLSLAELTAACGVRALTAA